MWIVSTHALCLEAIRDYETFSSKFIQKMSGGMAGADGNLMGPETLLSNDPPSHTYFRKLVNKAFSPNRVKKLSASISVIAEDLVQKLAAGPRKCIGEHFAMMQAKLVLAMATQRFHLDLVAGHPIEPEPLITLRPRYGLPMTRTRRLT